MKNAAAIIQEARDKGLKLSRHGSPLKQSMNYLLGIKPKTNEPQGK